jgi:ACS family hexuronate transporter-like MFS transporter
MPKQAISSVVGFGGFVAYFTGAVVTEIIGKILQTTGSYASIFAAASLMYVTALLVLHLLVPRIGGGARP